MSQQIAALARETGARLIEPEGRRVRLTPAGQASPSTSSRSWRGSTAHTSTSTRTPSQPATVRVGGFATGIRHSLLPIVAELTETFPKVHFVISEYEPIEAFALLTNDDLDLALTYDYNLALASPSPVLKTVALWSVPWRFGVPADTPDGPAKVGDCADRTWIVNSRNTADEDAVRTLASLAGFTPQIAHEIDSLDLVEDLITTGETIRLLIQMVEQAGGSVVGIGCLWQRATKVDLGKDVFSLVKRDFPTYETAACPLCARGLPLNAEFARAEPPTEEALASPRPRRRPS